MKIVFCLNHFLPYRVAGIEVYTFNLALRLQALGVEVCIVTPHFDGDNDQYFYGSIKVRRYEEQSVTSREMITGGAVPVGIKKFLEIIKEESPTVIHFQEVAGGRGISLHHLRQLSTFNMKMVLTCHLSTYSCDTGNLMFKEKVYCDGVIRTHTCTACAYYTKGLHGIRNEILQTASQLAFNVGFNTLSWNNTIGTAIGYPFLIRKKKENLLELSRLCERLVVLTDFYNKILKLNDVPPEKIIRISQGITRNIEQLTSTKSYIPLRIAFVGRICEDKGVLLLLKAIQRIPIDQLVVHIFGPVTEPAYYQECKRISSNNSNVIWKGAVETGNVPEILLDYDLLCLPSTFSEMSPLVIQEAFAAGIPVLASNVYGNAEQIEHGKNGWLFEFKNIESLQWQIEQLISFPEFVDVAKNGVMPPKDFVEMAREHVALYEEIINFKRTENILAEI